MLAPRPHPYLVWYHFKTLSEIKNLLPTGASVLDLGCGEGLFMKEIKNEGMVCGLDLSKRSLKQAMTTAPTRFWVQADAEYLPFQDGSFHVVVSHQLIEHLNAKHKMINEVSRILMPEGTFVITTPVKGLLGNLLARSRNIEGEKVLSPDHVNEYKSEKDVIHSVIEASQCSLKLKTKEKRSVQLPLARLVPWLYGKGFLGPMLPAYFYYDDVYLVFIKINEQANKSANFSES